MKCKAHRPKSRPAGAVQSFTSFIIFPTTSPSPQRPSQNESRIVKLCSGIDVEKGKRRPAEAERPASFFFRQLVSASDFGSGRGAGPVPVRGGRLNFAG